MNRNDIILQVEKCVIDANMIFIDLNLKVPKIEFYQKGCAAGRAHMSASGDQKCSFNEILAKENSKSFKNTISHEVAHLVTYKLYPKATPHGPEFKKIHRLLGGKGERCHSYNTASVKVYKTVKRYIYSCGCGTSYDLTSGKHLKAFTGRSWYSCRICDTKLVYTNKIKTLKK